LIRQHVIWAIGAGLVPIPVVDVAAVTLIQMDMLKQLAALYEVDFQENLGRAFVSSLTGSTFALVGSTLIKAIPGVGSLIGGLSMSALAGASTYAIGKVAADSFAAGKSLGGIDLAAARAAYERALEEGKGFVQGIDRRQSEDIFEQVRKLGALRDEGLISAEEFEAKKQELLSRL
jgi:uncharacterized protein (DUF697 family)